MALWVSVVRLNVCESNSWPGNNLTLGVMKQAGVKALFQIMLLHLYFLEVSKEGSSLSAQNSAERESSRTHAVSVNMHTRRWKKKCTIKPGLWNIISPNIFIVWKHAVCFILQHTSCSLEENVKYGADNSPDCKKLIKHHLSTISVCDSQMNNNQFKYLYFT